MMTTFEMAASTIHLHPLDKWEGYNGPSQCQASNHLRDGDFDLQNQQLQKIAKLWIKMAGHLPLRRPIVFPCVNLSWEKIVIKITISMIFANSINHDHDQNSVNHDHNFNDQYPDKPRSVWRSIRLLKNSSLAGTLSVTCGIIIILIFIDQVIEIFLIIQAIKAPTGALYVTVHH